MREKSTREIVAELVEPDQVRIVAGAIGYFEDELFQGENEFSEEKIKLYVPMVLEFTNTHKDILSNFNLFDRYKLIKLYLNENEDHQPFFEELKQRI